MAAILPRSVPNEFHEQCSIAMDWDYSIAWMHGDTLPLRGQCLRTAERVRIFLIAIMLKYHLTFLLNLFSQFPFKWVFFKKKIFCQHTFPNDMALRRKSDKSLVGKQWVESRMSTTRHILNPSVPKLYVSKCYLTRQRHLAVCLDPFQGISFSSRHRSLWHCHNVARLGP